MSSTAVIINEFGEGGLDHELVESSSEDLVLLQSGCLCCTIRSDLIETLRSLFFKRARGDIPPFDRLVIETTGLADPAPILHTFMTEGLIAASFRLDGVVVTVDAAAGMATMDRHLEAVKQAAVADRILLTKCDLADESVLRTLESRLKTLNPAAPIIRTLRGAINPAQILEAGLYNPKSKTLDVQRWLNAEAYIQPPGPHHGHGDDDCPSRSDRADNRHAHDPNRHDAHIRSICVIFDKPVDGDVLDRWLDALLLLRGPNLLRIKGIINVLGLKGPFIIHGVQHVFHPPVMLNKWPSKDRRTRIVFITRDIDEAMLRQTFTLATHAASPNVPVT
jgi:G3E family GTPase